MKAPAMRDLVYQLMSGVDARYGWGSEEVKKCRQKPSRQVGRSGLLGNRDFIFSCHLKPVSGLVK